ALCGLVVGLSLKKAGSKQKKSRASDPLEQYSTQNLSRVKNLYEAVLAMKDYESTDPEIFKRIVDDADRLAGLVVLVANPKNCEFRYTSRAIRYGDGIKTSLKALKKKFGARTFIPENFKEDSENLEKT